MAIQNPTLALNVVHSLHKLGLVTPPAVPVDDRYVVISTTAKDGTLPNAFISEYKKAVGGEMMPGAEAILAESLLNYPKDGELALKLDFGSAGIASNFEHNVMPLLEDVSDIIGRRLRFIEPFPEFDDSHGVFKLICVGISSPPALHELVKVLREGGTPDKGSVAIWAATKDGKSLGQFSFEVFDSCRTAAKEMTSRGIQISGNLEMIFLARRCVATGTAQIV